MTESNDREEQTFEKKPRKVYLCIEDDGATKFSFKMMGDIERIGKIPTHEYSAAEFWGVQFFELCKEFLGQNAEIKDLTKPDEEQKQGEAAQ